MSLTNLKIPKVYIRLGILVHTAIAGASVAAVVQLASREVISQVLLFSTFCFSIAIPTSVAMVFISQLIYPEGVKSSSASRLEKQKEPLLSYLVAFAEQISFFVGVLTIFWNFHPAAGVLFLVFSLLAILTINQVEKRLKSPLPILKE
ncbi:MAG: hypothetical protein ACM3PY_08530 [Omnitrophica WOR_2 bacterium]